MCSKWKKYLIKRFLKESNTPNGIAYGGETNKNMPVIKTIETLIQNVSKYPNFKVVEFDQLKT